jgi:hypothetical protein
MFVFRSPSVTYLPIKDTNKHSIFNLGDTNDVRFNLTDFLDFNPIKSYFKSHILSCTNGTIQDITFKFRTGPNTVFLRYNEPYVPADQAFVISNFVNAIMNFSV